MLLALMYLVQMVYGRYFVRKYFGLYDEGCSIIQIVFWRLMGFYWKGIIYMR
jgi:hypothetical protein